MDWLEFGKFCEKHKVSPEFVLEMLYEYLGNIGEEPSFFEAIHKFLESGK